MSISAPMYRLTRLRLPCVPARRVHSWSPTASSRLAFFDSQTPAPRTDHPALDEFAGTQSSLHRHQALYGQLLVTALLRTEGEPSSSPPPPEPPQDSDWISDQEWEIRTGRAIYILRQTLPDYFKTGLISSLDIPNVRLNGDKATERNPPSSDWSIKSVLGLSDVADTIEPGSSAGDSKDVWKSDGKDSTDSIYSPRVRLSYTPPIPLPAPFPKTLHVEGLHLYIASSVFLRHTLNAIYTDLHIDLRQARVQSMPSTSSSEKSSPRRAFREKAFVLGLTIHGVSRVSKAPAQWDVNCTYTFSPASGLVLQHSIDSIEPAPTQALFEALGKFGLLGGGGGRGGAGVGS